VPLLFLQEQQGAHDPVAPTGLGQQGAHDIIGG
jgi:hypothetical protein